MDEPQRILVVEDDPILRDLLADWLQAAGYRVGVAANGGSGIAQARERRPALIVTDMQMPGIGGGALISEIGRIDPPIPIIAISAHFRSGYGLTPQEVIAHGAARALAKPFKRNDLLGAVSQLVGPPGG